jgi:hypothetical protein
VVPLVGRYARKQDPTQYKRAAVVGIGALTAIATGTDDVAARITSEHYGRGSERIGDAMRKGAAYLADASDASSLLAAYKDARVTLRHQSDVEKGVIRSSSVLYEDPAGAPARLAAMEAAIDKTLAMRYDELRALYGVHATRLRAPALTSPGWPPMTPAEQEASRLMVECVNGATRSGCANPGGGRGGAGGRGGGGGRGGAAGGPSIPQHMNAELTILLGRGKTVLEIRDFLTGEFEPLALADLMAVLKARVAAGTIRLVDKPAEPARKKS